MFIELELSTYLSPSTLATFEPQLSERRNRREQSRHRDEKEKRREVEDQRKKEKRIQRRLKGANLDMSRMPRPSDATASQLGGAEAAEEGGGEARGGGAEGGAGGGVGGGEAPGIGGETGESEDAEGEGGPADGTTMLDMPAEDAAQFSFASVAGGSHFKVAVA